MSVRKATPEETKAWLGSGLIMPNKALTRNQSPSKNPSEQDGGCPYCSSQDHCDHLLLMVDLTFRNAEGGAICSLFNDFWSNVQGHGDENFDEAEEFQAIVDTVDGLSSFYRVIDQEGGPGMSSTYQIFYGDSSEKVEKASLNFKEIFECDANG